MKTLCIAFLAVIAYSIAEQDVKIIHKRGLASNLNYGYLPPKSLGHDFLEGLHTYGTANNFDEIAKFYEPNIFSTDLTLGGNYGYPTGFDTPAIHFRSYDQNLFDKHLNSHIYNPDEFTVNNNFQEAILSNNVNKIETATKTLPVSGLPKGNSYNTGVGLGGYTETPNTFANQYNNNYKLYPNNQNNQDSSQAAIAIGSGSLGITRLSNGKYAIGSGSLGYAGASIKPPPTITNVVAVTPAPPPRYVSSFSAPNNYYKGY